jgi:hypothetical protein
MHKAMLFSILLAALLLSVAGRAWAQVDRFQGQWKTTTRHAHYLLKLDIAVHGDEAEVGAWAACEEPFTIHCGMPTLSGDYVNDCPVNGESLCGPIHLRPVRADVYATSDSDNLAGKASALVVTYGDRLVILEPQGDKLSATVFSHGHVERDLLKH